MYLINDTLSTLLPFRIYMPDGSSRTCLNELTEAQLAELDIYPVDEIRPELLTAQHYGEPTITIADGKALVEYSVLDYSEEQLIKMLSEAKKTKIYIIEEDYNKYVSSSFICSLGYPMQFNVSDSIKMEGVIQLLEASGGSVGYITDAEDITHYNIPLTDMRTVKIEMLSHYAEAHAKKQILRAQINDAMTIEGLELITWVNE